MTSLRYLLIVSVVIIFATTNGLAEEFTSYFFSSQDIIFFAYEDGTSLSLADSYGNPISIDPCELNKGDHVLVNTYGQNQIFKAIGSKKYAILMGDVWDRHASGFYAMDTKGRGVSRELYTYVPTRDEPNQKLIVFAYQNNTNVNVQDGGQFNTTFTLDKGGHWEDATLSDKYVHITANNAVSALTCSDNEYFVPSSNGRWSGTEFYTYLGKLQNWAQDLTVIAYYDDTSVSIKDSDTQDVIWEGTLDSGHYYALSYSYDHNISKYFTITSSKTVTVSAFQWISATDDYYQTVFIPDINGTGIGTDFIGPKENLEHTDPNYYYGYLRILAHSDDTHVEEYNSVSVQHMESFTLNAGESVCSNQEAGLWRIISDKAVSVYSGYMDHFSHVMDNGEFVPLSFNQKLNFFELTKYNNDPNNDCVEPFDPNKQNYLIFDINWSANGYTDTNVFLVDKLPYELDYNWSSYPCDYNDRKITWNLGNIGSNDSGHIVLKTKVNRYAAPCGQISNSVEMEGNSFWGDATCEVSVCPWGTQIIYVDRDANHGFNNGTNWDNAYLELQDALTQARNCPVDVTAIWVAGNPKPYQPVNDVNISGYQDISFELPQGVALIGHFGGIGTWETSPDQRDLGNSANETILDGQIRNFGESVKYIVKAQDITDGLIDGFTIQRSYNGAGIYLNNAANVSVVNCKIKDNSGDYPFENSHGLKADYSYPFVYNCTFIDNANAGIDTNYCDSQIILCIFDGSGLTNSGVSVSNSSALVEDSILFHTIYGIYADHTDLTMTGCLITDSWGSGIYAGEGSLILEGSVIRSGYTNGIELYYNHDTTIKNNWIHNNNASGISFTNQVGLPLIRNNTIYDNHTYGIHWIQSVADPNIVNCIIYGNDTNDLYRQSGTFNKVNYCLLQHPHSGFGNRTGDPCFINVGSNPDDLHISENSQCKNAGDPNVNYGNEKDIDGEPRVAEGLADLGGDEYYWSPADYDHNGIVNFNDYARFAPCWLKYPDQNGYDPNCDFDADNYVNIDDLAFFCQDWLWEPAWGDDQWMAMSGGELDGMSQMVTESTDDDSIYQVETDAGLMLPDVKASRDAMPERLRARTQKFYDITPETTAFGLRIAKVSSYKPIANEKCSVEEIQSGFSNDQIQELIDWTEELWESEPNLREMIAPSDYECFLESLKEQIVE